MTDGQTARIGDREYPYTRRHEDGAYEFEIDGAGYRFRQWLWGEKNRVIDAATVTGADGSLRVDLARFNELMLATSLLHADGLESVTPQALRQLNPVLGDTLLAVAYWVNELPAEKKSLTRALRSFAPHPGLVTFRLCREFGWTPRQVREQTAADVEELVLILEELDRQSALVPSDEDVTTILISED